MTRLYKTTFTLEVLSDKAISALDLQDLGYEIMEGDCSGKLKVQEAKRISPMQMAEALEDQGSDRNFLLGDFCGYEQPHLLFEYDETYTGGDYNKDVGDRVLIPESIYVEKFKGNYQRTFKWWTGLNPIHIVWFSPDDRYTAEGNLWEI